jgi:chorismate synthase
MGAEQTRNNYENEGTIKIKKDKKINEVKKKITIPRPGHADLAGLLKYGLSDIRNISERASARETAARTAMGGLMDCFLDYFNLEVGHYLKNIGDFCLSQPALTFRELKKRVYNSSLSCYDKGEEEKIKEMIDRYQTKGDTLGGVLEVITTPLPVGLGDHIHWDDKLDGKLAQGLMSIPAVKGVEIGPAFRNASLPGSKVHDEIYYDHKQKEFYHKTNRAGGVEGGISNGEPLRLRVAMKPLPTLYQPLNSVNIKSGERVEASIERSDVTALPAAGIVAESMVAFVLARELLEKFGGDNITETMNNFRNSSRRID